MESQSSQISDVMAMVDGCPQIDMARTGGFGLILASAITNLRVMLDYMGQEPRFKTYLVPPCQGWWDQVCRHVLPWPCHPGYTTLYDGQYWYR